MSKMLPSRVRNSSKQYISRVSFGRKNSDDKYREEVLIKQVVDYLNQNSYVSWRQQNTGHFNSVRASTSITSFIVKLMMSLMDESTGLFASNPRSIDKADIQLKVDFILSNSWEKIPSSIKGVSDVIGYKKSTGTWICVEIKIGTDRLSPDQSLFLDGVKQAGGESWLVRDFESFRYSHSIKR